MTYNFDPDRWYDNERDALQRQFVSGELDAEANAAAVEDLERRYEEMVKRLDGSYQIPEGSGSFSKPIRSGNNLQRNRMNSAIRSRTE